MTDPHQEATRKYLDEVTDRTGLSLSQIAQRAKLAPSTLNRFRNDAGVTHTLSLRTLRKIQSATGVPLPATLTGAEFAAEQVRPEGRLTSEKGQSFFPDEQITADLPVLGHFEPGFDDLIIKKGVTKTAVERPSFLIKDKTAYAVHAPDDRMAPVIALGNLLYVTPSRPAIPGDDVVLRMTDDRGLILRLVSRSGKEVVCKQFNPEQERRFKASDVRAIDLIAAIMRLRP